MPKLSHRAHSVPASPIRNLSALADAAKARGVEVFHLNIGQPDLETPPTMRELSELGKHKTIAYGPSEGDPELRSFLRDYYAQLGVELQNDELAICTGASEALLFAFAATCDPGDAILCPEPLYANYRSMAELVGIRIQPLTTRFEDNWQLPDFNSIDCDKALRIRALLLCNPANPTGAVLDRQKLLELLQWAKEKDLFVLVDEVYREFVFDSAPPPSALKLATEHKLIDRVIVIDSLSKRYSFCGGRLGCIVSKNSEVMAAASRFAQARLCPPTLAQLLAKGAARLSNSDLQQMVATYRQRRDAALEILNASDLVELHRPAGAFYLMARVKVDDTDKWMRFMLQDFQHEGQTTMVAPGAGFYVTPGLGNQEIRIAFVLETTKLKRALEIMLLGIEAYRQLHMRAA